MSKEFDREPGNPGIINLESYLPYLETDPASTPIAFPKEDQTAMIFNKRREFVYQHIYFPEAKYRQEGVSPSQKNWGLNWMRRVSYNQVIMRREKETQLHKDYEREVTPPEDEIVAGCLEDYAHLDIIGAAIMGKIVATHPEVHDILLSHVGRPVRSELTPSEKVEHFEGLFERSFEILKEPLVTPERVITSGLKRIAIYLGHKELESEADARIRRDGTYYPLRVPKLERLLHLSNLLLVKNDNPVDLVQPSELVLARNLQREAEVVEIAA